MFFDWQAFVFVFNWQVNGWGICDFDQFNICCVDLVSVIDIWVDKKWFFDKWSLNIFFDIENVIGNGVGQDQFILDCLLDENG